MFNYLIKCTISLWFCVLVFTSALHAQEKPYREPSGLNNWYVELGGAAFLYSLNYEKVLYKSTKLGWVGRVGVSYNFMGGRFLNKIDLSKGEVLSPFTTSILLGSRERKEKLEFGLGFTLVNKSVTEREIVPTLVLGFRVVETNKTILRIGYTPFIRNNKFENWFGVSLGRNFGTK
ncbi:MAG: hypothetical protein KBE91_08590 [Bacteroidia bacterium]|nr:hypothetical protein [Bacteroidia bacterium]MBP9689653.1 hypothetical protein [Bacteroidia bacterium]